MDCPFCGEKDTKVVDSRLAAEGEQIRRRRECMRCTERFTTYEVAELVMPRVIKRDGSRVPFDENKLRNGILRALEKRPVAIDQIEDALNRLRHKMRASGEREIGSQQIGAWVMETLHTIDKVAYVRFASVYRSFTDVKEFRDEVERLSQE